MPKEPVDSIRLIEDYGIEGDAHAGKWHRQVSLLSYDRVEAFNRRGGGVDDGGRLRSPGFGRRGIRLRSDGC